VYSFLRLEAPQFWSIEMNHHQVIQSFITQHFPLLFFKRFISQAALEADGTATMEIKFLNPV
jgi:hypothetical protein